MARHNVIYVKAWCSRDNPLGKVVTGTPSLANGIRGRCFESILRLASMLFVLLSVAIDKDRSP